MKNIPSVTVIIPAYNAERFIVQALDSVLAQTYEDYEIIVVDDGSTDDTKSVAEEYARQDPRIKVIQQPNQGVGAARNAGINIARGKYVAPLDADDIWFPTKLEKQVALLEEKGADWGMAYCWSKTIGQDGEVLSYSTPCTYSGNIFHPLFHLNFIGNGSVPLFRTDIVRKLGGYLTRHQQGGAQGCEDWYLMLNVSAQYQSAGVPGHLVGYRSYGNSMSQNVMQMAASYEAVVQELCRLHADIPKKLLGWSAGNFYIFLTMVSHCSARNSDALKLARKAVSADPFVLTNAVVLRVILASFARVLCGPNSFKWRPIKSIEQISKEPSLYLTYFDRLQSRRHQMVADNWQRLYPQSAGKR
jgi:glycosyltransferase involved in cell wall biosynthesis